MRRIVYVRPGHKTEKDVRRKHRPGLILIPLVLTLALFSGACGDGDGGESDGAFADPMDAARALAETWMAATPPESLSWSWDSGVLMMGFYDLYAATGEKRYRDYAAAWIDHHIQSGYVIAWNDHVPPALIALRLFIETGRDDYMQVAKRACEYIFEVASRTPEGGLNHMGSITGNELWVDTLFMVAPFLVEMGRLTGDAGCFDEAALQFDVFAEHLRDPETGMYRHSYNADTGEVLPPVPDYWGRGNAWITAASGLVLGSLPADHPGLPGIRDRFLEQARAMAALADERGLWHTIMNRPDTYLETSAGLLLSLGIYRAAAAGVEVGDLLETADLALGGGLDQVVTDELGDVLLLGTSYGTNPSTWEMYQEVLAGEQVAYGVGSLLLAASARHALGRSEAPPTTGETVNDYVHPPAEEDPAAEWGYFHLARGDASRALDRFLEAAAGNASDPQARFGEGLMLGIYFALDALDLYNDFTIGGSDLSDLLAFLACDGRELGRALTESMRPVLDDPGFARRTERIVISSGGSAAVGAVELDRGEAYILDAAAKLLWGAGDLIEGLGTDSAMRVAASTDPTGELIDALSDSKGLDKNLIVRGLDRIARALGVLAEGIAAIDAEADDQSDDLLPANLFRLEGTFGIPGILLPTPVDELLAGLGIDPAQLFGDGPMPGALIDWLHRIRGWLEILRNLVDLF